LSESLLRTFQDLELNQHAQFISADPFFRNLSLAEYEDGDSWPVDYFSCYRVLARDGWSIRYGLPLYGSIGMPRDPPPLLGRGSSL
jgi:hypothetical protein